ncbi:hypothetical protein ES707_06685 [subsurface metagenome]
MKKIDLFIEVVRQSNSYPYIKMVLEQEGKVIIYSDDSYNQAFMHTNYIRLAEEMGLYAYIRYNHRLKKCYLYVFA